MQPPSARTSHAQVVEEAMAKGSVRIKLQAGGQVSRYR